MKIFTRNDLDLVRLITGIFQDMFFSRFVTKLPLNFGQGAQYSAKNHHCINLEFGMGSTSSEFSKSLVFLLYNSTLIKPDQYACTQCMFLLPLWVGALS